MLFVSDICILDVNKWEVVLFVEFNGVVGVFYSFEFWYFIVVCWEFVDVLLVDWVIDNFVVGLEKDGVVVEVVKEGLDSGLYI